MMYIFDEILQRMTYTVLLEGTDVDEAVRIAKEFTKLNLQTKEYLLARLQMITEEEKSLHSTITDNGLNNE